MVYIALLAQSLGAGGEQAPRGSGTLRLAVYGTSTRATPKVACHFCGPFVLTASSTPL